MHGHDLAISAAENYRAFAEDAHDRSPAYESLAVSVADDTAMLRFLGSLPPEKRQPNLLFGAARYLLGDPVDIARLRALVRRSSAELAEVMMARRTHRRAGPPRHDSSGAGPAAAAAGADRGRRQCRADPAVRPLLLRLRRAPDRWPGPASTHPALHAARAGAAPGAASRDHLAGRA